MRKRRGLIFDCDGTLVDSEALHLEAWRYALALRGQSLPDYSHLAGLATHTIAHMLSSEPEALVHDKKKHYNALIQKHTLPLSRNVAFLKQLFSRKQQYNFKFAIASAASKAHIFHYLEHLELLPFFDAVVSGSDDLVHYHDAEGVNKPKPYVYLEAAKQLQLPPEECIAFEDSLPGISAANAAGLFSVALPNAFTQYQDFSSASLLFHPEDPLNADTFIEMLL